MQKRQGDRIGRIFAHCVIVNFVQFFENYRSGPIFGYFFRCWATFWVIYSQTHLVTLKGDRTTF
jgi:hypothetical protein